MGRPRNEGSVGHRICVQCTDPGYAAIAAAAQAHGESVTAFVRGCVDVGVGSEVEWSSERAPSQAKLLAEAAGVKLGALKSAALRALMADPNALKTLVAAIQAKKAA